MTKNSVSPYFSLRVREVIDETPDTRSFVLDVPDELSERFAYRAGQFLTFRLTVDGKRLVRCYSLASSPDVGEPHKFTVKRVEDGRVSNAFNDSIGPGFELEVMHPAGLFCLHDRARPVVLFGGGSGITPLISIIKTTLATTDRSIRLFYANRDEASIIFARELAELASKHSDRLEITHRLDDRDGFADAAAISAHVGDERDADFYICGPGPYMDVVEEALAKLSIPEDQIFIERFTHPEEAGAPTPHVDPAADSEGARVTITLDGETREVTIAPGETILAGARRAGLDAPFACEEGYCGCCMATLVEGQVEMTVNDALDPGEIENGWVLTCQGVPKSVTCKIEYPE